MDTLSQTNNTITFTRKIAVKPYIVPASPGKYMRYNAIIVSPENDPLLPILVKYLENIFPGEKLETTDYIEAVKKRRDVAPDEKPDINEKNNLPYEKTKPGPYAVINLSNPQKETIHLDKNLPSWVKARMIISLVYPHEALPYTTKYTRTPGHNLWIANDFKDVPAILFTFANLIYFTSSEAFREYAKRYLNADFPEMKDTVIVVSMFITKDLWIMSSPRSRWE